MFTVLVVVAVLLALSLIGSAAIKITRQEPFVSGYRRVGVPDNKLPYLAGILLAGATGLLVGLVWVPLGVAAAAGLVAYFALGVAAHLRVRDQGANLVAPVALGALAALALVLRLATA